MSVSEILKKQIFLEGVACMGKTTSLSYLPVKIQLQDYYERSQRMPFLLNKDKDVAYQIFYTATFLEEMTDEITVWDRSPWSDIIYMCIHEEMEEAGKGIAHLKEIFKESEICKRARKYKVVVVLPSPCHVDAIVKAMKERANGLDIISPKYVVAQSLVFMAAAEEIGWNVVKIPSHMKLYTDEHTFLLTSALKRLIKSTAIMEEKIVQTTEPLYQSYKSDAGYDLTVKHDALCFPNELTKISLKERVCIPEGYYGQLCARSSTNKLGILLGGAVDAGYTGDLDVYFIAHEKMYLETGRRFAQIVILPLANLPMVVTEKLQPGERGTSSFGSSGKF